MGYATAGLVLPCPEGHIQNLSAGSGAPLDPATTRRGQLSTGSADLRTVTSRTPEHPANGGRATRLGKSYREQVAGMCCNWRGVAVDVSSPLLSRLLSARFSNGLLRLPLSSFSPAHAPIAHLLLIAARPCSQPKRRRS